MPKKLRKSRHCLNCGHSTGHYNFCPDCGQENTIKHVPLHYLLRDFLGDFFTFDSRFFRSFVPLIGRPGHLTNEYNCGRRVSYVLPIRLYIFTTVLFFFIISVHGRLGDSETENLALPSPSDSLRIILTQYSDVVPADVSELIGRQITRDFNLSYKNTSRSVYRDSVYQLVQKELPQLSPSKQALIVEEVFQNFKLKRKKKKNSKAEIDSLAAILTKHSELADGGRRLAPVLDSLFSVRQRKLQQGSWQTNQGIVISFGEVDSASSSWEKDLSKKIENLSSMGEVGESLFWREMLNQIPKVMFIILPVFALLLKFIYLRQRLYYISHLIFALHAHTVIFIYLIFALFFPNVYVISLVVVAIWLHLFISMRTVYRQSYVMTFLKLQTLIVLYIMPLVLGFAALTFLAVINV